MTTVRWRDSVTDVAERDWAELGGTHRVDSCHGYLHFREHVEPGRPVVVTAHDAQGLSGALHGAATTPGSGLFSHPWKLLTAPQFRRAEGDGEDGDGAAARAEHAARVGEVCGAAPPPASALQADGVPGAGALTAALGEALVIRGFDTSQAQLRTEPDAEAARRTALALLRALQTSVREGAAGAVALPYVREDDAPLRAALTEAGFRSARLTATTEFEVPAGMSYEELLTGLSRRHRHRYRKEEREFGAAGLRLEHRELADVVQRVAELETSNTAKHGGRADREKVAAARTAMARLLGKRVRVPVAVRDERVLACGLHLADGGDYCVLLYGSDAEGAEQLSTAYPCLTFYEPLRHAAAHGGARVRFGFEGFGAKLIRGATLRARETWLWVPDPAELDAVHRLLRFLESRWTAYRDALPIRSA